MLFTILAIWFGYKKARDTGRNPILWAAICGVTFIGVQLISGLGAGVLIGLGIAFAGWDESAFDTYSWLISLVGIAFSCVSLLLLYRYLDHVPVIDGPYEPPPPPNFRGEAE